MNREETIKFIVDAIRLIEGVEVDPSDYIHFSDRELLLEADWYDYLLDK